MWLYMEQSPEDIGAAALTQFSRDDMELCDMSIMFLNSAESGVGGVGNTFLSVGVVVGKRGETGLRFPCIFVDIFVSKTNKTNTLECMYLIYVSFDPLLCPRIDVDNEEKERGSGRKRGP
jgi:hypothetical protein